MSDTSKTEEKQAPTGQAALNAIFDPFNRADAPGLIVGVAHWGRTIYRRGTGLASLELGVANSPRTRMRIGSTSKHFTCLAALLLAEDEKLRVDDPVRKYVPELPAVKVEPTLLQLMNHTNGYRDFLDMGFIADGMAIKPKGLALAVQVRQADINFEAGEKMMYNNGGYHLLSVIIERMSGMRFEEFLKERIFLPLHMHDTDSVPSDFEITPGMASMYVPLPEGGWRRGIFPNEEVRGEGGMVSCVDDMLVWLSHLRGQKIIGSQASWKLLTTPTKLNNGLVNPYALGLMRNPYRGVETIHHAGGVIGGSCQMLTVPEHELDIIIMTNATPNGTTTPNPVELGHKVIDAMLGDVLRDAPQPRAETARFKSLVGARYYAPDSGFVVSFLDVGGKLGMSAADMPPTPLRDDGDALRLGFEDLAAGPIALDVFEDSGAPPKTLEIRESGLSEHFELLPAFAAEDSPLGSELMGRYRCADLDANATIDLQEGKIRMRVFGAWGTSIAVLTAYSNDVLGWQIQGAELPLRGVMSLERVGGKLTAFKLDTLRTRHLRFERIEGQPH